MGTATHATPPARPAEGELQGGKGGSCAPAADPAHRPLLHDWSLATRGDLRLLASALRRRWPVPPNLPTLAIRAALEARDPTRTIAAAWVLIRADEANLEAGG